VRSIRALGEPINACLCPRVQQMVGQREWKFGNTRFCNAASLDNGLLLLQNAIYHLLNHLSQQIS